MSAGHTLNANEVAALADTTLGAVAKAIQGKAVPLAPRRKKRLRAERALLPGAAVAVAVYERLEGPLARSYKMRIGKVLRTLGRGAMLVELQDGLTLDVEQIAGDVITRTKDYVRDRAAYIVSDPEVMGATPVIKGTRITVYAIQGRLSGGDTIRDILKDHPFLSSAEVETAFLYAKAHPRVGRPSGEPRARSRRS